MATYDPDRPNVATGEGKVPTKKGKGKGKGSGKPARPKAPKGGYDWGDGKGAVHSVSARDHQVNMDAKKGYGVGPTTPLDAPLTAEQAYRMANATANREYAPQIAANMTLQRSTPVWYQNYVTQAGQSQQAAQAYAQPIVSQAQAGVQNAKQTAPGLDPNSPQYAAEQQAAAGRSTMAQNSANYLGGVAAATNAYFGGQQAIAARDLPQTMAYLVQQGGQLGSLREGAVSDEYGRIRTGEQNASIARSTLNLNTDKAAADVVDDAAKIDEKRKTRIAKAKAEGKKVNQYGYTNEQWQRFSASHRARVIAESKKGSGKSQADKDAEKAAKEAEKKTADIKKASGSVKTDVTNLITKWNSYRGQVTDDTTKPKDPVTGEYPARKITPADIKRILGQKTDAELIHVMLLVRTGKPLDRAAIDYLHRKDPNIRIPREWLKGKSSSVPRADGPGDPKPTKGQQNGLGGK